MTTKRDWRLMGSYYLTITANRKVSSLVLPTRLVVTMYDQTRPQPQAFGPLRHRLFIAREVKISCDKGVTTVDEV